MGILADLTVRVGADIAAFRAGMTQVDKDVESSGGRISRLGTAFAAVGAASTVAIGFLSDAARASIADAASTDRLRKAVENSGGSWRDQQAAIEARIKAGQDLAFTDDQTRDSLSLLIAQTGSVEEALKRQKLAYDLSRGANIDLQTASKLLGKVTDENVNVLARYGIHVEKGASQTELFASVQQKFGGQAKVYADGQAGAIDRLKDRISEWKESVGGALGPYQTLFALLPGVSAGFTLAGSTLGPLIGLIRSFSLTATLATVRAGAIRVATLAWTAVQWLLNVALTANPIGLVVVAIAALVAGFILAYKNIGPFRDFINSLWSSLQRFASWVQANFLSILREMANLIGSLASFNIGGVTSSLHALHVPGFQYGGTVGGDYVGQRRLIFAEVGEQITPIGGAPAGGGGSIYMTNHFHQVMGDPQQTAFEVGWTILKLRRRR